MFNSIRGEPVPVRGFQRAPAPPPEQRTLITLLSPLHACAWGRTRSRQKRSTAWTRPSWRSWRRRRWKSWRTLTSRSRRRWPSRTRSTRCWSKRRPRSCSSPGSDAVCFSPCHDTTRGLDPWTNLPADRLQRSCLPPPSFPDALEAYRLSHVTLQDTVKKLAEEAIRTCGRLRSGKLNFDQFCVWAKANPLALDRCVPRRRGLVGTRGASLTPRPPCFTCSTSLFRSFPRFPVPCAGLSISRLLSVFFPR